MPSILKGSDFLRIRSRLSGLTYSSDSSSSELLLTHPPNSIHPLCPTRAAGQSRALLAPSCRVDHSLSCLSASVQPKALVWAEHLFSTLYSQDESTLWILGSVGIYATIYQGTFFFLQPCFINIFKNSGKLKNKCNEHPNSVQQLLTFWYICFIYLPYIHPSPPLPPSSAKLYQISYFC